jgi:hypothetical protein
MAMAPNGSPKQWRDFVARGERLFFDYTIKA